MSYTYLNKERVEAGCCLIRHHISFRSRPGPDTHVITWCFKNQAACFVDNSFSTISRRHFGQGWEQFRHNGKTELGTLLLTRSRLVILRNHFDCFDKSIIWKGDEILCVKPVISRNAQGLSSPFYDRPRGQLKVWHLFYRHQMALNHLRNHEAGEAPEIGTPNDFRLLCVID